MVTGNRAIIIGAGRGQRLMPTTANGPKCFAEVQGRRLLDWTIEALTEGGADDICFIGGYLVEAIESHYPALTLRHNRDWANNNILCSLMCAEDLMDRPFVACYSDILFSADIVRRLFAAPGDIVLGVDTDWREHYRHRTQHPPDDAEKVIADGTRVRRVQRSIPETEATGEFIGVVRFSLEGARLLRAHFHRARERSAGGPFREAERFDKAYLIHLFQEMIEAGVTFHQVETKGQYREIDTQEDLSLAQELWRG